jgi:hypothetical protein
MWLCDNLPVWKSYGFKRDSFKQVPSSNLVGVALCYFSAGGIVDLRRVYRR